MWSKSKLKRTIESLGMSAGCRSAVSGPCVNALTVLSLVLQTTIFNTFKTFVQVHQQLLSILISKRGILSVSQFFLSGLNFATHFCQLY